MASTPKHTSNHATPAQPQHAAAKPPPAPERESDPPAAKPEAAAAADDISNLTLSYMTTTAIARLEAAHQEVAGWTSNLEKSLQADVEAGALTQAQAEALAAKYDVQPPEPAKEPKPAA